MSALVRLLSSGACAAGLALLLTGPAPAQETPYIDLQRGALLINGNFCGPGNRGPGHPPIDALDLACMHHDACTPPPGRLAHCACNDRLNLEASAVVRDPATPRDVRGTAQFIADGAMLLPCED